MIWQSKENDKWYVNINGTNIQFNTQLEATQMANKLETAKAIIKAVQSLAPAADNAANLKQEYFDVGAPVDADVAPLGITAAQLAACITLLEQFDKLMTNQATSAAAYTAILNSARRV